MWSLENEELIISLIINFILWQRSVICVPYLIQKLSKQIPYGSTNFKNAKDQMKKKIKNIMKYSNERFNKEGPRKFRKNNQRKSKVVIPKEAYAHLKSQYKKILWILLFYLRNFLRCFWNLYIHLWHLKDRQWLWNIFRSRRRDMNHSLNFKLNKKLKWIVKPRYCS